MGESVERAGVGCSCNPYENNFADNIYEYYSTLDQEAFSKACDIELDKVMSEYAEGQKIIKMI